MGLGAGGTIDWQAPADLYDPNYPPFLEDAGLPECKTDDGLINESWKDITINKMLGHIAGFSPNQSYLFDEDNTGSCSSDPNGLCGSTQLVSDPTVAPKTLYRSSGFTFAPFRTGAKNPGASSASFLKNSYALP